MDQIIAAVDEIVHSCENKLLLKVKTWINLTDAEWTKSDIQECILNDSTYMKFKMAILTSNDDRLHNSGTSEGYWLRKSPRKDAAVLETCYLDVSS